MQKAKRIIGLITLFAVVGLSLRCYLKPPILNADKIEKITIRSVSNVEELLIIDKKNEIVDFSRKINSYEKRISKCLDFSKGWEIEIKLYQPSEKVLYIIGDRLKYKNKVYTVKEMESLRNFINEEVLQ